MNNGVARLCVTVLLAASGVAGLPVDGGLSGANEIQQSLERVGVVGNALMIAAHPDDENTAVLAWLSRGRHVRTAYLSLTRGEGGQNLIGPEQGDALGVIRTQELLDARRIDGAEQFFTRAIDFGFSKSPKEAIAKWGHDEILSDIVWVIRRFRPDVIILRFSGTPDDGHGHHQASAILGREAFDAAGDPARFPEQLRWVKPWKATRLVWNAFAFNPEQEKKAAATPNRIAVDVGAFNPVLGRSYAEIAGISRSQHRTQSMGAPQTRGPSVNYFVPIKGDVAKNDLFDGVDISWKRIPGGDAPGELLAKAANEFSPEHPERILPLLAEARDRVAAIAVRGQPSAEEKLSEIDRLVALCAGLWLDATCDRSAVAPGDTVKVNVTALRRLPGLARWENFGLAGLSSNESQSVNADLLDNQVVSKEVVVRVPLTASYSQPFWLAEPPQGSRYNITDQQLIGRADPVPVLTSTFDLHVAGTRIHVDVPVHFRYVDHLRGELTRPLEIVPPVSVNLPERAVIFPSGQERRITVQVKAHFAPVEGSVKLDVPKGWSVNSGEPAFRLDAPGSQKEVVFTIKPPALHENTRAWFRAVATVNGREIVTGIQAIEYEHIPPEVVFRESSGVLQPENLEVLARNVGYVMGAGDNVPDALRQMGLNVTLLSEADLLRGDLSRFDAIVTGVRAYNVRQDLAAAQPRLLAYIENGGTMVVQYNVLDYPRIGAKPLQPGPVGPYSLEISRERVVDEDSPVSLTSPDSPLLHRPNAIGPEDFTGWIQERGLYFADKWDPRYSTLIATHDVGEKDLPGGTLYTRYGKGAYVFTAYSWFRELPAGVPGAYRLFANLLSAGRTLASSPTPVSSDLSGH